VDVEAHEYGGLVPASCDIESSKVPEKATGRPKWAISGYIDIVNQSEAMQVQLNQPAIGFGFTDSTHFYTAEPQGVIRLLDISSREIVFTYTANNPISDALVGPSGKYLATRDAITNDVAVLDAQSQTQIYTDPSMFIVDFSSDGNYLVTANDADSDSASEIHVIDLQDESVENYAWESYLMFVPKENLLITQRTGSNSLAVKSLETGIEIASIALDRDCAAIVAAQLSEDNSLLALSCGDNIGIWEVQTGRKVTGFSPGYYVDTLVISPDNSSILTASVDPLPVGVTHTSQANLWDATTGLELQRLLIGQYFSADSLTAVYPRSLINFTFGERKIGSWL
jgi:WD40 repeat protein